MDKHFEIIISDKSLESNFLISLIIVKPLLRSLFWLLYPKVKSTYQLPPSFHCSRDQLQWQSLQAIQNYRESRREAIQQEGRIQEGRYPRREYKKGDIQQEKKAQLSTSFLKESWEISNIKTSKFVSSWLWRKLLKMVSDNDKFFKAKIMVAELQ